MWIETEGGRAWMRPDGVIVRETPSDVGPLWLCKIRRNIEVFEGAKEAMDYADAAMPVAAPWIRRTLTARASA